MIISLAQGYEKAILVVAEIVKSRPVAINLVTDSVTRPLIPSCDNIIAVTYFPRCGVTYGNGVYAIATLWDIDLTFANPIDAI